MSCWETTDHSWWSYCHVTDMNHPSMYLMKYIKTFLKTSVESFMDQLDVKLFKMGMASLKTWNQYEMVKGSICRSLVSLFDTFVWCVVVFVRLRSWTCTSQRIACNCKRVDLAKTQSWQICKCEMIFTWQPRSVWRCIGSIRPFYTVVETGGDWAQIRKRRADHHELKRVHALKVWSAYRFSLVFVELLVVVADFCSRSCTVGLLSQILMLSCNFTSHFVRLSACIRPVGTQCIWLGLRICCTLLTLIIDLFSDRDGFSATNES